MAELPPPPEGIVLAHFIVSDDVERSRRFYTDVLGGTLAFSGDVTYVALSNSWIIINVGGGPTDDKPAVTLETSPDPDRVSSFLNIRVKDIAAVYAEWSARGANFLTPPKQHRYETRCYIREPDGHLIEVGQTTDLDPRSLAVEHTRRGVSLNPETTRETERAPDQDQRTECQQVAVRYPLLPREPTSEIRADRRERDVDPGRVESDDEGAHDHRGQGEPIVTIRHCRSSGCPDQSAVDHVVSTGHVAGLVARS